jgi:hypothetical protein
VGRGRLGACGRQWSQREGAFRPDGERRRVGARWQRPSQANPLLIGADLESDSVRGRAILHGGEGLDVAPPLVLIGSDEVVDPFGGRLDAGRRPATGFERQPRTDPAGRNQLHPARQKEGCKARPARKVENIDVGLSGIGLDADRGCVRDADRSRRGDLPDARPAGE